MSTEEMTLDQFLGHQSRAGGGGQFLTRWKQNAPPVIDIWLHTRASIVSIYQHPWPRIVAREDKNTNQISREVWGGNFNSWEDADTLKRQYLRDKKTDERRYPPKICPVSLMIEAVRTSIRVGLLSWVTPLFKFVGDDPTKGRVLHAAGLYNGYGGTLSDEEKTELHAAGIYQSEAWRENQMAKCNYVFIVVDNAHPENGLQIASETTALGTATQEEIGKVMTSLGHEAGNPMLNPYCIRWSHHPDAAEFSKKYAAIRMERIQLTPTIRELICDTDPPDLARLTERGNVASLRASMEEHYVGPEGLLDWDEIFGKAEAIEGPPAPAPEESVAQPAQVHSQFQSPAAQVSAPGDELVACDHCQKAMKAAEDICPHCGYNYASDPTPAQPPLRSRSEVGQVNQPAVDSIGEEFSGSEDDLPF